jgi:replication factor C subunit 3/5
VIQELLKEVAQTQQVDLNARQRFKVDINEADVLTRDAQAALRRTIEKYSANVRLILLANSTAGIIAPIRSRTLLIRVPAPTESEICAVLQNTTNKEKWKSIPALNERTARESSRNLRHALLMLEAVYAQNPEPSEKTPIPPLDWEVLITQIADDIIAERLPKQILVMRAKLYDLLTHCIPPTMVIKTLCWKLVDRVDDQLKPEMVKWAAFY